MAYDVISKRLEDLMVHSGLQDEYNNLYDKIYRYINRPENNTKHNTQPWGGVRGAGQ